VTAAPESAGAVPGGIRGAWAVFRLAAGQAREHRVPMIAQALAYSLFLAIPASLLVLLGIFSLVSDPSDVGQLVDRLESVMPAEAAELLGESLERSSRSTSGGVILTVIGFLLAVWTTTSAATALMEGITTAFGGADERGFVRKRLVALVIVACLLVLGPHLERWLGDATGQQSLVGWLWWTAQWPILIVVLLFAFAVVLALGPSLDERPRIRVSAGSAVALAVWLAASGGLAVYSASFGSFEKTWGTLSAVVVTLVWLWLGGAALLLGAEIDAASRALRERPSPA
jgi:membrane protein